MTLFWSMKQTWKWENSKFIKEITLLLFLGKSKIWLLHLSWSTACTNCSYKERYIHNNANEWIIRYKCNITYYSIIRGLHSIKKIFYQLFPSWLVETVMTWEQLSTWCHVTLDTWLSLTDPICWRWGEAAGRARKYLKLFSVSATLKGYLLLSTNMILFSSSHTSILVTVKLPRVTGDQEPDSVVDTIWFHRPVAPFLRWRVTRIELFCCENTASPLKLLTP